MSRLKTLGRRIRHRGARALLRPLECDPRPVDAIRPEAIDRLLIVRPNFRMGNLLLTTPALSAARRALPGAEIDLLATPAYHELLDGHPDVDRVLTFDRSMLARPWSLVGLVRRLRARRYDLLVDASEGESLTGALLARLSGARRRAVASPSRYDALFDVRVPRDGEPPHRVERLLGLLERLGIAVEDAPRMSIALDEEERSWADARRREWGVPEGFHVVGVNIGARGSKRWPMASFARLVERLREEPRVGVVVFAGPEDLDRLEAAEERLPEDVAIDTTHEVRRFAALLERCAAFVTGDTGPMHLAAAVGTPVVSIFRKDNHRVFAPRGPDHRRLGDARDEVTPEAVLEATAEVLGKETRGGIEG